MGIRVGVGVGERADRPARRRPSLAVFGSIVACSAFGGALGLACGFLDLGATINARLPFGSPVVGGLALVVGVPTLVAGVAAMRGSTRTESACVVAGALLIGWIGVETAVIRVFSFLQPFFLGVGVVFVVVGRRARHRSTT